MAVRLDSPKHAPYAAPRAQARSGFGAPGLADLAAAARRTTAPAVGAIPALKAEESTHQFTEVSR
jgi:hypothetical protein